MQNRNWNDGPAERIEQKLREAQAGREKAVEARVHVLEAELGKSRGPSAEMQSLRGDLE